MTLTAGLCASPVPAGADYEFRPSGADSWRAANPRWELVASFTREGALIATDGASWRLATLAIGRGERITECTPVEPEVRAGRLEYDRATFVEWYANDRSGIEQGFAVRARPAGAPGEPLDIHIGVTTRLAPAVHADARGVDYRDAHGRARISYAGLAAWDARGAALRAWLETDVDRLTIRVDDRDALYPVDVDPLILNEDAKITASDAGAGDELGHALALDQGTLVVTARADDDRGPNAGAAYVFDKVGGAWIERPKITASDGFDFDVFGESVDLDVEHAVPDTLVVGATGVDAIASAAGAAYVFVRAGTSWSQQAKLTPFDGAEIDRFGRGVAIHADTLAVGSHQDDDLGTDSGSVYVYTRSGAAWTIHAKLTALDGAAGSHFGETLDLGVDRLVVGAPEHSLGTALGAGTAYVFRRSGGIWTQEAQLIPADSRAGQTFGSAVAMDGDRVVVGAELDGPSGSNPGAAYVFQRAGTVWSEESKLVAINGVPLDRFGSSVDIDGDRLIVGAVEDAQAGPDAGAAFVFRRAGSSWFQEWKLVATDTAAADRLGEAVGLSGGDALAGAPWDDDGGSRSGSAYAFVPPATYGDPFCFGDGSGNACPCGNESAPHSHVGCENSTQRGGTLLGLGSLSVAADDLLIRACNLAPGEPALMFSGTLKPGGGLGVTFGDGFLCAGGAIVRHGVRAANATGSATWGPGLGALGGWMPSDMRHFQVWYRDPSGSPCGSAFNLTNAIEITFEP